MTELIELGEEIGGDLESAELEEDVKGVDDFVSGIVGGAASSAAAALESL